MNEVNKKYKYLYKRATSEEVIRKAYKKLRKKKTRRPEVQEIDRNLDYYIKCMQVMLENTKPDGVPVEHPELAFRPKKHEPVYIQEGGKLRKIYKPSIIEQWVHHIIMVVLEPILMKRFYNHSNGSIPGRGPHRGRKVLLRWIKQGFKYFVKADVRHYYDSIRVDRLIKHLETFIADDWFIHLIRVCLMHHRKGIPIGYYISQWLGNSYLTSLDRMILKSGHKRYMRYVDDIVIGGDNKRKLHKLMTDIKIHLGSLRLKVKHNWQICRFDYLNKRGKRIGRPIDFMGFKFYRDKIFLRKNIIKNTRRTVAKIRKAKEAGERIYHKHASSLLSRMGWIKYSDTYQWYERNIKPFIEIRKLKRIVSKLDRRKEGRHDRMEKRGLRHRQTSGTGTGVGGHLYRKKRYQSCGSNRRRHDGDSGTL